MAPRKGSCGDSPDHPRKYFDEETSGILGDFKNKIITDNTGKKWKLGNTVGVGGFGEIYDITEKISSRSVKSTTKYVCKIEKFTNGPLFVEIHCYLRMAKLEMIEQWKKEKNLKFLGVPHFIASGSHMLKGQKFRFLILPKYKEDLETIQKHVNKLWNVKTVLVLALRIIDSLEYIHSHGYVHSDIKASNIMMGYSKPSKKVLRERFPAKKNSVRKLKVPKPVPRTCKRTLRPLNNQNYIDDIPYLDDILNEYENVKRKRNSESSSTEFLSKSNSSSDFEGDQVYLMDYGLATKYILSSGELREFCSDQRRAHAGTILFCSRDAHKGIRSSRSDLESLAYNMVYWLTGTLPWKLDTDYPAIVQKKKDTFFSDINTYLEVCFQERPRFLVEMFTYLSKLQFDEKPNYDFFRILFKRAIKDYGYKDDEKVDFENLEGIGRKDSKTVMKPKNENESLFEKHSVLMDDSPRKPLSSNVIFKRPKLRKKVKDKLEKNSMMNWSKILVLDPETIIKQGGGNRKNTEGDAGGVLDMDLESLNPTPAMRQIFTRASEREEYSPNSSRGDELCSIDNIEGYTPEMMRVHRRMIEERELELERAVQASLAAKKRRRKRVKRSESPSRTKSRNKSNEGHPLKKVKSVPLKRTYSLRG